MNNKTILITGSTSGLGRELTKLLASNNKIIMLGRNPKLLETFKTGLLEIYPSSKIDYVICNYNNYNDIKEASKYINKNYSHIDLIIHNAGAVLKSNDIQNNSNIKINFLSPLLLNELLSPLLINSNNPTLFYTSSLSIPSNITIDELNESHTFGKIKSYGLSKLAFNLYLINYANSHNNMNIKIFDPGIIYTNAVKATLPKYLKWIFPVTRLVARKPEKIAAKALLTLNDHQPSNKITYYKLNKVKPHKNIIKNIDKANEISSYGKDLVNRSCEL